MKRAAKMYIRARESVIRSAGGQTAAEYALILAAIAVMVYGICRTPGNHIITLSSGVDSTLTNATRCAIGGQTIRLLVLRATVYAP